ncbi:3-hydroxyacyl-CoA dehydrogenase family protein [Acidiplasma sp.]|uniref:3-hydroxyacyl-CoA dehydrogenase family protein n=1 Tax=Acidiplasma sp. TaxID=1872114 RepID=UPI00258CDC33|nr:3-hydroxyacyl-CoA dehydrogenase family protein [Acidiplasma sp.]
MFKNIGIIGAGAMGSAIAEVFAYNEFNVVLKDVNMDFATRGLKHIEKIVDDYNSYYERLPEREVSRIERMGLKLSLEQKEKINNYFSHKIDKNDLEKRIKITDKYENLSKCDLVIEAAFEKQEIKNGIFKEISGYLSDDAIMATNTSSLSVTEMASYYKNPKKVILMHFFNPPYTLPLVEIAPSTQGSDDAAKQAYDLLRGMKNHRNNMQPVMTRDKTGFIVNRILLQVINEAIKVYDENIATKEDIDTAMKYGAGFPMGPFELADYVGLDIVYDVLKTFKDVYGDRFNLSETLTNLIRAGYMGRKSGRGFYDYTK